MKSWPSLMACSRVCLRVAHLVLRFEFIADTADEDRPLFVDDIDLAVRSHGQLRIERVSAAPPFLRSVFGSRHVSVFESPSRTKSLP
jgi:hypothetical protein